MENNTKVIDLSKLSDEKFEAMKKELERWIDTGATTSVGFISNEDMDAIKKSYQKIYDKGVINGALAVVAGIVVGELIGVGVRCYKQYKETKKAAEAESTKPD